jgi:hypothetical protein
MTNQPEPFVTGLRSSFRLSVFALSLLCSLITITVQSGNAQTYTVLHNFTGGPDGGNPYAGLTITDSGKIYGTTTIGGPNNFGVVFNLMQAGTGWVTAPIYGFQGCNDGNKPEARVINGADGSLYGTTYSDQCNGGYGMVFRLRPSGTTCRQSSCPWNLTVLHRFTGGDGGNPTGDLTFGGLDDIYGTAGVVYPLAPSEGGWTESVLYDFRLFFEGHPVDGVTFDNLGNLYGTTPQGGDGECYRLVPCGTIFRLNPTGLTWAYTMLYSFQGLGDGLYPYAGLVRDTAGHFYGVTSCGGSQGGGEVFDFYQSGGSWVFSPVYGLGEGVCPVQLGGNSGPAAHLTMDAAGNLYGAALSDGIYGAGYIFKLTPTNGGWIYTELYDFTGGADGGFPHGIVSLDAHGNIYGTTIAGGSASNNCNYFGYTGCGVIWKIAQ